MRYKNIKTGAIIDSSFNVSGGDWVPYSSELAKKSIEIVATDETNSVVDTKQAEEPEENLADFDGITRAQIMQELDAFGVEYDKRANKQTLYDLMMAQGK